MNREILFRGFHLWGEGADKIFYKGELYRGIWVYGWLTIDPDLEEYRISGWNYYSSENGLEREPFEHIVLPETVGQYTGLSDKNGKKIFEHDIVQCGTGRVCKVTFFVSSGIAGFDLVPIAGFDKKPPYNWSLFADTEVIGNIHDNPELIGGVGE